MKIERFIGGNLEANGFVIYRHDGGDALIIDPGYSHKRFTAFLKAHSLRPIAILLTHHHHDHSDEADVLANEWDCPVRLGIRDIPYYKGRVDAPLEGGECIDLDGETIQVFATPGHTAGGLCFYSEQSKVSFTGDTIFNVDLGYTHFPGGSAAEMRESLRSVINAWGNDITIYPGHGDPATMKYVRASNQEFLDMVR